MSKTLAPAPLRAVPPSPADPEKWKQLLNLLYLYEEDELFRWCKDVRAALPEDQGDGLEDPSTGARFRPIVVNGGKEEEV